MRTLVAGVGAVGGWLLARLTEGGADVTGWARGETYERLAAGEPLTLRSSRGDWSGPVRVVAAPEGAYDVTFVCTKSSATAALGDALAAAAVGGTVVSAQNGVENAAVLAERLPSVVGAVVYAGCRRLDALTVQQTSGGRLVCDVPAIAAWLDDHRVPCLLVDDVRPVQWRKLMGNVVENSLSALLLSRVGPVHAHRPLEAVIDAALGEVAAVAAAEGVALPESIVREVHDALLALPPDNGTSMLWDREEGRPLEVDAITGVVVRRGDALGVQVPTVRTLDALLRFVSA